MLSNTPNLSATGIKCRILGFGNVTQKTGDFNFLTY